MTRPKLRIVAPSQDHSLTPAFEAARVALAKAKSLDEVAAIPEEFDRLRAASRIASDVEVELMVAEIKLREVRRIGEISRSLDKAKGGRGKTSSGDGNGFKLATLKKFGVSKSKAYRAEQVAAVEPHHFERYFEQCRREQRPTTVNDLIETVVMRLQVEALPEEQEVARPQVTHDQRIERIKLNRVRPLDRILGLIDKITSSEQRIAIALKAASGLSGEPDAIKTLRRLLQGDDWATRIAAAPRHERSAFIARIGVESREELEECDF